jgi:hypothetical protein
VGSPVVETDTIPWRWAAQASLGLHQMREDLLAPYRYTGPLARLGLSVSSGGERTAHGFALRLGASVAANRHDHGAAALAFGARYGYALRVAGRDAADAPALWLGGVALVHTDDLYFFDWDDAHLYWLTVIGAGPSVSARWRVAGGGATATLEVPVAALVSRPPEDGRPKVDDLVIASTWVSMPFRDLGFATLPELTTADLRISWARSRRIRWFADVLVRSTREPERLVLFEQAVGLEWSFR